MDDVSYHDPISLGNAYSTIHTCEGSMTQRAGNDIHTSLPNRSTQQLASSWLQTVSWAPIDDPTFALDPDGRIYEDIVEGDVMDEELAQVPAVEGVRTKKKRSRVSVSPFYIYSRRGRSEFDSDGLT